MHSTQVVRCASQALQPPRTNVLPVKRWRHVIISIRGIEMTHRCGLARHGHNERDTELGKHIYTNGRGKCNEWITKYIHVNWRSENQKAARDTRNRASQPRTRLSNLGTLYPRKSSTTCVNLYVLPHVPTTPTKTNSLIEKYAPSGHNCDTTRKLAWRFKGTVINRANCTRDHRKPQIKL